MTADLSPEKLAERKALAEAGRQARPLVIAALDRPRTRAEVAAAVPVTDEVLDVAIWGLADIGRVRWIPGGLLEHLPNLTVMTLWASTD